LWLRKKGEGRRETMIVFILSPFKKSEEGEKKKTRP